jgi:hypothetical protein
MASSPEPILTLGCIGVRQYPARLPGKGRPATKTLIDIGEVTKLYVAGSTLDHVILHVPGEAVVLTDALLCATLRKA